MDDERSDLVETISQNDEPESTISDDEILYPSPEGEEIPASVLDNYDSIVVGNSIDGDVSEFVSKMEDTWCGKNRRYHQILSYRIYWRNTIFFAFLAFVLVFATCVISAISMENAGPAGPFIGWSVHGILVFIAFVFVGWSETRFGSKLKDLKDALYHGAEHFIQDDLIKELEGSLSALPAGGGNVKVAEDAAEILVGIFVCWRKLERVPSYLANQWNTYRLSIRDERQNKMMVGWVLLGVLWGNAALLSIRASMHIAVDSNSPDVDGSVAAVFPQIPPELMFGTSSSEFLRYVILSTFAAPIAATVYQVLMNSRKDRLMVEINEALGIGTKIFGASSHYRKQAGRPGHSHKVNWRARISERDPTEAIVRKYKNILEALIQRR